MPSRPKVRNARARTSCRTSVTLPAELHRELGQIAKEKKVSTAWVIRDAVEQYVKDKWPLFAQKG
jgi:predicted transcriptional regulator